MRLPQLNQSGLATINPCINSIRIRILQNVQFEVFSEKCPDAFIGTEWSEWTFNQCKITDFQLLVLHYLQPWVLYALLFERQAEIGLEAIGQHSASMQSWGRRIFYYYYMNVWVGMRWEFKKSDWAIWRLVTNVKDVCL